MASTDLPSDPQAHAVGLRYDDRPWGLGWRAECSCGWRGHWQDRRPDAEREGAVHQATPTTEGER